ncbi:MAG: TIGR00725 family protein [Thermoplasmataceae archaeon]
MVNISVIGGSTCPDEIYEAAREIGRLLARSGATVICGGLGGVMEAVARGTREEGGKCIGILPGSDASEGNEYLTAAIPTGIGFARDFLVVRAGDAVIAIDGQSGTSTEAYFAMSEKKPLICLYREDLKTSKNSDGPVVHVNSPEEAVRDALKLAKPRNKDVS